MTTEADIQAAIIEALVLCHGMFKDLDEDDDGDCPYCLCHLEYTVVHPDHCDLSRLDELITELSNALRE